VRYDRLFIDNITKNVIQGLIRAPGWSGGTIAEIGGSLKDTSAFFKEWKRTGKAPEEFPDRVAYTIALMLVTFGINGMLTYLFTGEPPEGMDWWAFRTGGVDEKGRPERFLIPTYAKDVFAYYQNAGHTLLAKLHPQWGMASDLIRNKDYYNTQITNPDDPFVQRQIDRGTYILKQFIPFWIRGVDKTLERGGGITPLKILGPQFGVMPATSAYTKTKAEKMISEILAGKAQVGGRTKEAAEKSQLKSRFMAEWRNHETVPEVVEKALEDRKITGHDIKEWREESKFPEIVRGFKKLPTLEDAQHVWKVASENEKDLLQSEYRKKIRKRLKEVREGTKTMPELDED
jgi:hypothetical protein